MRETKGDTIMDNKRFLGIELNDEKLNQVSGGINSDFMEYKDGSELEIPDISIPDISIPDFYVCPMSDRCIYSSKSECPRANDVMNCIFG